MFREIVHKSKNSVNGNGLRKALVYDYPLIDVIVRESIQNSLDALKPDSPNLSMEYRTGFFETMEFENVLDGADYDLPSRFGSLCEFLEIRDSGTFGLDGPEEISDDHSGRWTKLVYSFADKQTETGKGGSWGYGKTCYFNIGVGFVIYYSKTCVDGMPVSRLAVVLVEDTDHKDAMIIPESKQGVTYWGDQSLINSQDSRPLSDEDQIKSVLRIFGISPFQEDETGTSIIIPFISRDQLVFNYVDRLHDAVSVSDRDFDRLVLISVQRWYFTRLLECENPRQKPMYFSINGTFLSWSEMEPVFKSLKALYSRTFESSCNKISVRDNIGGGLPVAFMSYEVFDIDDLPPSRGMSLGEMFLNDDVPLINSVGLKCRESGMIVGYDIDKDLVRGVKLDSNNQILMAVLRTNPDAVVTDRSGREIVGFDEYVRRGEPPTHDKWMDVDLNTIDHTADGCTPKIMSKLISNANGQLTRPFKKNVEKTTGRNVGMSRKVGKLLFPEGFFDTRIQRSGSGGYTTYSSKRTGFLKDGDIDYSDGGIIVRSRFKLGKESNFRLRLVPDISGERIRSAEEWESETLSSFPYTLESITILSVDGKVLSDPVVVSDFDTEVGCCNFCPVARRNGCMDELSIIKNGSEVQMDVELNILRKGDTTFPFRIVLEDVTGR